MYKVEILRILGFQREYLDAYTKMHHLTDDIYVLSAYYIRKCTSFMQMIQQAPENTDNGTCIEFVSKVSKALYNSTYIKTH